MGELWDNFEAYINCVNRYFKFITNYYVYNNFQNVT